VVGALPPPPPPPPPEEKPKEDPKAKPKEKPKEKPKGGQQRGGQLRIPDNPSDLSFLQGCWKSDAGIVDRINRMPLMYYYCFNGSTGAASVRVEEQDNRGRVRNVCTTTGKARLSGKGVTIRDNGAKCPGSVPNYVPGTVNCAPSSGGSARCTVQSDGGPRIQTRFTYQG
jgi:hypothetical protein